MHVFSLQNFNGLPFVFHESLCISAFWQIACTGAVMINPGSVVKNVDLKNLFPGCGTA